jgi:hypothetical protein
LNVIQITIAGVLNLTAKIIIIDVLNVFMIIIAGVLNLTAAAIDVLNVLLTPNVILDIAMLINVQHAHQIISALLDRYALKVIVSYLLCKNI